MNEERMNVDLHPVVRPSDELWKSWFAELMKLATANGITTSDDADLWWDDFGNGKTPQESMRGFLDSLPNAKCPATEQGEVGSD